ncbi:MAG: DUF1549 and DUF1553 domain-containing protein [Planctomycetia bacterium]|nr:DUF1549 and DUF1553 domain-containing protein [Planctomycetia bacterium]
MISALRWGIGLGCILAAQVAIGAKVGEITDGPDRARMLARVDELLAAEWQQAGVTPTAPAGDAEFLRRAYLDLAGTIPTAAEARTFFADADPDKRAKLIDRLTESPAYASHLANVWRQMLLPGDMDIQQFGGVIGFERWLRGHFAENTRYDNVVADLLVTTGAGNETGPALFYTALQLKPEDLAARTARIFLGVQIECAQCHDHPFDKWKQKDFWGYAAFFARLRPGQSQRRLSAQVIDTDSGEVMLPETTETVEPRFLDGQPVDASDAEGRRRQLAIWLASRDNPYFARAAVNRAWALLFGRGLIDPVDDMRDANPPSHPELLEELANYFIDSGYDMRELFRTLARTRAYQLSSEVDGEPAKHEQFARMSIKTLSADQLYDSLLKVMRRQRTNNDMSPEQAFLMGLDPERQAFRAKFQSPTAGGPELQSGIPQALTLMNGAQIVEATDLERSGLLGALEAPFLSDEERVEALFLSSLTRLPTEQESSVLSTYLANGGANGDRRQALSDVCWALLNSAEFSLNH